MKKFKYSEQAKCKTYEELLALGKSRQYYNPEHWAKQVWASRQKKENKIARF